MHAYTCLHTHTHARLVPNLGRLPIHPSILVPFVTARCCSRSCGCGRGAGGCSPRTSTTPRRTTRGGRRAPSCTDLTSTPSASSRQSLHGQCNVSLFPSSLMHTHAHSIIMQVEPAGAVRAAEGAGPGRGGGPHRWVKRLNWLAGWLYHSTIFPSSHIHAHHRCHCLQTEVDDAHPYILLVDRVKSRRLLDARTGSFDEVRADRSCLCLSARGACSSG